MDFEKNKLNRYKELDEFDKENLFDYLCYQTIYDYNYDISDEDVIKIFSISKNSWLDDSNDNSVYAYISFIMDSIYNNNIDLEKITNVPTNNIIDAVNNGGNSSYLFESIEL